MLASHVGCSPCIYTPLPVNVAEAPWAVDVAQDVPTDKARAACSSASYVSWLYSV